MLVANRLEELLKDGPKIDLEPLRRWFLQNARMLPWRELKSPYRVWVSEIMLQQTQVKTVIPYFERWLRLFPTIRSLAEAEEEAVIKAWEGLGYYARARSLHRGAKYVLESHGGQLPENAEELRKIPGLGPYTVGAILSFAFQKRKGVLDGNVARVLARLFAIGESVDSPKVRLQFEELSERILPDHEPWVVAEALMELGATNCRKKADCFSCPLSMSCLAFQREEVELYPVRRARAKITHLERSVAVIYREDDRRSEFLVKKGEAGKVMEGLYEFLFLEGGGSEKELNRYLREEFKLDILKISPLATEKQSFTRYSVKLAAFLVQIEGGSHLEGWKTAAELKALPFSAGHRRILSHLIDNKGFR